MIDLENLQQLTEEQLKMLRENADRALQSIIHNKRKFVIAQIKDLADSINMVATLTEKNSRESGTFSSRKGVKLQPKYCHPHNPELTWTGRGQNPSWMRDLLAQGYTKESLLIQHANGHDSSF